MVNNLYTNNYAQYISDTFNIKKREYRYTAELPINIITKLQLNDLLIIKGSYYRINKYSYNLLTGKTEFDLINYFGSIGVGQVQASRSAIRTDYKSKPINITVYNLEGSTFNKVGVSGDGVDWVTINNLVVEETDEDTLKLTILENSSTARALFIDITKNGITTRISVNQSSKILTVDNNTITVDSDLITVDNNYFSI